jgi:hypothetical protein
MSFTTEEQALIGAIKQDVNTIFDERSKGLISQDAYKSGIEDLNKRFGDTAETLKAIQDALATNEQILKAQGLTLEEIQTKASKEDKGDIEYQLTKYADQFKAFLGTKSGETTFKTEYTRSSVTSNPMGYMLSDIQLVGAPVMTIYDSLAKMPVGAESNGVIRYIDQTTNTRNAAATAESNTMSESAIAFQGYTLPIEYIGAKIPITEETFRHTKKLAAEIELFIQTDVKVAIESNLATGDGISPNLKGLYTSATAYTAAAGTVDKANIADLIIKMSEDMTGNTTYGGKYMPNVAYMNISDINGMMLNKDTTGQYVIPPFVSRDSRQIGAIRVIETPFMTANTCIVGDSRMARIYTDGGYEFAVGYNASGDFGQRVLTLRGGQYLGLLVRTIDATGWRKSSDIVSDVNTISIV